MKSCTSTFRRSRGARTTAMKEGTGARGGWVYASSAAERSNCGDAALASHFFLGIHEELWEIVLMHTDQGCCLHPSAGNTANPGNFRDFLRLVLSLPEEDRTIRRRWLSPSPLWLEAIPLPSLLRAKLDAARTQVTDTKFLPPFHCESPAGRLLNVTQIISGTQILNCKPSFLLIHVLLPGLVYTIMGSVLIPNFL